MTAVTDSDIKELKDLINSRFDEIQVEIKTLETGQRQIENRLTVIETRLDEWKPSIQKISDLTEKVGELKNWKQVGLIVITAMISSIFNGTIGGVIGWLIKGENRI
jgi:septal ring factor EnvC (AmiA/AmiB activator)